LVKDGATAIETLGDSIDASLVDLKGGTTGQVLAKASNTDMDFTWTAVDPLVILDAKGDLITATAADTPARLAVGADGETLVADSSTATGLSYQANFAAGKNKIINGDFGINQRGFSSTTSAGYCFDRWTNFQGGGTVTRSAQVFTPGTAPVAGYESSNFLRITTSGQSGVSDLAAVTQFIEDVRTFAGQTATVSFWAKASSGTPSVSVGISQVFGTGGSPSAGVNGTVATGSVVKKAITGSWARYTATITIPSIAGKTIGTTPNTSSLYLFLWVSAGSDYDTRTDSLGIQNNTFDFWGVQMESGSTATAFQTATGTIQGELAACQRYYFRTTAATAYGAVSNYGFAKSSTEGVFSYSLPVTMRTTPTSVDFGNIAFINYADTLYGLTSVILNANNNPQNITGSGTVAGATAGHTGRIVGNNNSAGFLGFSAEL
jgi:hypothetical protein